MRGSVLREKRSREKKTVQNAPFAYLIKLKIEHKEQKRAKRTLSALDFSKDKPLNLCIDKAQWLKLNKFC